MHSLFTEDSHSRFIPCQPSPATPDSDDVDAIRLCSAEVVHDLKNLLLGIDLMVASALRTMPQQPARECLEDVHGACREAGDLCRMMLNGAPASPRRQFSLGELVEEMSPLLQQTIPDTAAFQRIAHPHPVLVAGDRSQLKRAVLNLVKNAGEALPEGVGSVTIRVGVTELSDLDFLPDDRPSTVRAGHYAWLEVSDSGCGMDAATLDGLFERPGSTKDSGHGLGLLSVQAIVAEHRGLIEVSSERDRGTSFRILLPASPAAKSPKHGTEPVGVQRRSGAVSHSVPAQHMSKSSRIWPA